ncbi:MAG: spore cortex-lytic protein [Ruminococcaceae bacterium]|nr:spore cortex-lytic protein [Oscillospiraceae bacterium]
MPELFEIPENITVHLGRPDENASNVTVPFNDYIKNVASSEIYPTWNESAIRANVYAQISIALNRIFTEYYRSRGYDFDITNSTQFDQSFIYGRDYFSNISEIVDEIFTDYVVKRGSVQPYFTEYCDGIEVTCRGLSQWGSQELAQQGYTPYEILQYYYGDDIDIVSAPVGGGVESYDGTPLRLGSAGEGVRVIQLQLNRIAQNYPLIPNIARADGIFGQDTENAVKTFQQIFNITPDGVVGKATWYRIKRVYFAVKRISELFSEGITVTQAQRQFPSSLEIGDEGVPVRTLQFYLRILSNFIPTMPFVADDGVFGQSTRDAVIAFQTYAGLSPDGVVGRTTWNALINAYDDIESTLRNEYNIASSLPSPGNFLTTGSTGNAVELIQRYLQKIARSDSRVPPVSVDGVYGEGTAAAVREIQRQFGLTQTGAIGPLTWDAIIRRYNDFS